MWNFSIQLTFDLCLPAEGKHHQTTYIHKVSLVFISLSLPLVTQKKYL